jgi:uncharacterized membrane protein YjjP (DUF1212 family)
MVKQKKMGEWAFLGGVLLAIVLGLFPGAISTEIAALILVILGLLVGFLNIAEKEIQQFIIASIALLLPGTITGLGALPYIGTYVVSILGNIAAFVAPAVVIVALKAIWELASK